MIYLKDTLDETLGCVFVCKSTNVKVNHSLRQSAGILKQRNLHVKEPFWNVVFGNFTRLSNHRKSQLYNCMIY